MFKFWISIFSKTWPDGEMWFSYSESATPNLLKTHNGLPVTKKFSFCWLVWSAKVGIVEVHIDILHARIFYLLKYHNKKVLEVKCIPYYFFFSRKTPLRPQIGVMENYEACVPPDRLLTPSRHIDLSHFFLVSLCGPWKITALGKREWSFRPNTADWVNICNS